MYPARGLGGSPAQPGVKRAISYSHDEDEQHHRGHAREAAPENARSITTAFFPVSVGESRLRRFRCALEMRAQAAALRDCCPHESCTDRETRRTARSAPPAWLRIACRREGEFAQPRRLRPHAARLFVACPLEVREQAEPAASAHSSRHALSWSAKCAVERVELSRILCVVGSHRFTSPSSQLPLHRRYAPTQHRGQSTFHPVPQESRIRYAHPASPREYRRPARS
jgi:hypothetical protein